LTEYIQGVLFSQQSGGRKGARSISWSIMQPAHGQLKSPVTSVSSYGEDQEGRSEKK